MINEKEENIEKLSEPVNRLCSEIQLFDLCDLEKCKFKNLKFCTDEELLIRFEQIAEEDACSRINLSDVDFDEDGELAEFGFDDEEGSDDSGDDEEDV